jgi:hypothetical protein
VLHRHGDLVLAVERDVAREHLEEHDAERVEVDWPLTSWPSACSGET